MEVFKIIPNTNNKYEISNFSNIRRVVSRVKNHKKGSTRLIGGKNLSQKTKINGYKEVALYINTQKCTMKYVHRLMYETFISTIPNLYEINHKDGDKSNNILSNLELVSPSENRLHSYHVLGNKMKVFKGEKHHKTKLSKKNVLDIRNLYDNGVSVLEIHKTYINKISISALRKICYRCTWKHLN